MTVQSKDSYPSGFVSRNNNIFTITNNKLYFHAYVGGDETAVLMYDLSTGVSDFEKRLSFEGQSIRSITSYNGDIYVTVSYASSVYRAAQGANWTNSIDTYSGSGNSETSLIKLDAAMNPSLVRHFNHASYDYGSIENGTSIAGNGFLLNFRSGRFERVNLDGTTTHSLYLGEDARMKLGMNGNYIISKKKSAELRDANWALLKTVGKISYDDLNNVTVSGNDYMFSVGLPNFLITTSDGKQEWAFYFYDADLNFKYKKSGVKLEYFFGTEPQVKNFQIFDLSSSGYRKLGFYYAVPHIGTTIGPLVQLAGNDLPAATNSSPMTVSYYRSMSVPTEQITIQLGSSGKDLYLNKKLVNGVITAADQFSALIVTQNTDLEALVGSQVPATIATFTAPAGWSIWKDPSNTLGEWGKLYIQKDANGDYFVNIPMYDYSDDSAWVNSEAFLTNEVNKKIYLQNVTISDTDGDGVYDPNDLCPATPLGEVVDTNGCSQSQLDDDNDGVVNSLDQCPNTATGETVDANGCSAAQTDTDGDGVYDPNDLCPATPLGEVVDTNGCSQSQLDDDNDGVVNSLDQCPNTATGETVDANGCSAAQTDTDGDGVYDTNDLCPATPLGEVVDTNGCSASQLDDDGDGVVNSLDQCPNTATGETVDANGCSAAQTDTDGDGVYDTNDLCPATPVGETVDANGCSQSQLDDDNDGVMNNLDLCPNTAAGETVDANGCSDSQLTADDDNDGISNLNDDCPNTPTNDIVNTSGCSIINIPDVNFEQALIDLGFDSDGIINQQILSSDATVVTNLNLYGKNINDLTGIEGFNNLTTLLCGNNNLTYLNISQNTKLVDLQCNTNSLTSLDVSNNIALTKLFCAYNQITNLNVTNNILLEQLDCSVNQITSLDITNNSLLTVFSCHTNNPLNSLNIKNGNNTSIITFYANLNPNLTCITVDNVDWSTLNWTAIDSQTSYSENCGNNDTDGDGVYDTNDLCPATPDGEAVDTNGCSQSQLDDDNDGVVNSLDQCPNTPSGETVNVNGCSQSQIDDDGDGIMNDVDTCPNTPSGETVDVNGCSQSQIDDDGDGIMNDVDTCADTPTGEAVDTNGCSQSQLDDDNDGVVNSLDTCPNTPTGETVDANGCILLAFDNFTIEIISETCPNKNNGRIIISAQLSYNYIATINGADYDFTTNLTVDNLSPGNYEICIIVTNQTSPYCYNIVILEGTTISGKASVTTNKAAIEITQGTPPYIVLINGKEQLQTVSPLFTIDVKHGDLLEVKTGVACEGIFSKTIDLFEVITVYPNPTSGIFEIALPMSLKEIKIELFTTNNQLISSKTYSVINGKVQLNIENMPVAVYFAKLHLDKPVTLKIIKQ
ncbi:thrombospondin type 3 repeat-containing protein [Lutibacter sp.]